MAWQPDRCPNPHLCISGATGTGKTYTIRQIIETFSASGISFTVIDIHGDLGIVDSIVKENRLGYGSSSGVNPLAVNAAGQYDTFVGRIREDLSHPSALDMWIVADTLLSTDHGRRNAAAFVATLAVIMLAVGVSWGFRAADELVADGARVVLDHPLDLLELRRQSGGRQSGRPVLHAGGRLDPGRVGRASGFGHGPINRRRLRRGVTGSQAGQRPREAEQQEDASEGMTRVERSGGAAYGRQDGRRDHEPAGQGQIFGSDAGPSQAPRCGQGIAVHWSRMVGV